MFVSILIVLYSEYMLFIIVLFVCCCVLSCLVCRGEFNVLIAYDEEAIEKARLAEIKSKQDSLVAGVGSEATKKEQ